MAKQKTTAPNWQEELPFLDWTADGQLVTDLDDTGQWGYRAVDGSVVPVSDPRLGEYQSFLDGEIKECLAEAMRTADEVHDSIADPENDEPIPRSILRKRQQLAAWLIGENPHYRPTFFELKIVRPAFLERRRKIKERGLAGQSVRPFVCNDFQRQILDALDGKAMTKEELAFQICGGEGSRLYKTGGIKELMAVGKVANKRGLGYFRPDSPPPDNVVN